MKSLKQIIVGFLLIFFLSSLTRNLSEYIKNVRFYESYKKEYEEKKHENTRLKTQILKKSDPSEIEKTIRNKLNLAKPNELVIMVPEQTISAPTPTPTLKPVYQQWVAVLF